MPAGKPYTYYYVGYGYSNTDELFGASFETQDSDGSISYTINDLQSNVPYYFRVRAGNGCTPGPWSEWLGVRTSISGSYSFNKFNQQNIGIPFYTGPSPTETVEEIDIQPEDVVKYNPISSTPTITSITHQQQMPTISKASPTQTATPKPNLPPFENQSANAQKQSQGFFSRIFNFFTNLFSF